ncbi:MAG TPA: tetratricopeptide repeat protein [Anaerolineae bacterium]|nr:tetratricopeptide repeat protein [Anaerolineae bacterium]
MQGALRALDAAIVTPEAWPLLRPLTALVHPYMERQGAWTGWDELLHYLIAYAQQHADPETQITFLTRLGSLQRRRGDLQAAIVSFRQAWRLCRHTDDRFWQAIIFSNLGDLYCIYDDFWRAEVLCDKARALFTALGDLMRLGYTENHLGWIDLRQRQWDAAWLHFQRAEELFRQIEDENGLAMLWQNMSVLCHYLQQSQKALDYMTQALRYYEKTGDHYRIATIYLDQGNTYQASGDFEQAEQASLQAEAMFAQLEDRPNLARVRHNLGMIYTHTGNWQEAERCFLWALDSWRQQQDSYNLTNTLGELATMYIAWGQRQQAQYYLDAFEQCVTLHHHDPAYQGLHRELIERREKLAMLYGDNRI